ncbi:hypothetical protein PACTADRAFT_39176 [Pachysolen tannophilus NRRL Y-2460]|uniref:G10 protein n=1 Tax=Pachysolen tannophilus NRRL Y-2460 TaxID=669874 RepID=A0A1E4TY35_PACTA|nr:hypothetical protein PACTADRAFT_39176 [Pachysolen tannophilus NRRL Y-2460]
MPKLRTSRSKKPPKGFSEIEPTLKEFADKLRDLQTSSGNSKKSLQTKKNESLWPIYQLHHQRSRYIYDLYYEKKAISDELYQYLLKNKYADGQLIAKWKKQGYENLCCLGCIATNEKNHGSTCICRVPKAKLKLKSIQCVTCGCRGCASTD